MCALRTQTFVWVATMGQACSDRVAGAWPCWFVWWDCFSPHPGLLRISTLPSCAASTSVPAAAAKSMPWCGLTVSFNTGCLRFKSKGLLIRVALSTGHSRGAPLQLPDDCAMTAAARPAGDATMVARLFIMTSLEAKGSDSHTSVWLWPKRSNMSLSNGVGAGHPSPLFWQVELVG